MDKSTHYAVAALMAAAAFAFCTEGRTETTFVVQDCEGYNGWPAIRALNGKLLVVYNRAGGHEFTGGKVDCYARMSSDGARTWSREVAVEAEEKVEVKRKGEGEQSINRLTEYSNNRMNDSSGRIGSSPSSCTSSSLFWIRFWKGSERRHDLYRTFDGVTYEKLATPAFDPMPVQVMAPVTLPDGRLLSLWFAGEYGQKHAANGHSWGTLFSSDGGRTWRQRTVEANLSKADWPTEPSVVALGGGRLLAIARAEWVEGIAMRQLQSLTSSDGGITWKRVSTAITDVHESTPSLLYDGKSDELTLYYFHRGPGLLKRRTAKASAAFDDPLAWSVPETVACGRKRRAWDSGNVNAVRLNGSDYLAYYAGDATNATVLVSAVGPAESPAGSWEGRRVLFLGAWDAARVRAMAAHHRFEAKIYPTAEAAYADYPAEAFSAIVLQDDAEDEGLSRFPSAKVFRAADLPWRGKSNNPQGVFANDSKE